MDIGGTMLRPHRIAESPFLPPTADRLREDPPTVQYAIRYFYCCMKMQINGRTSPFQDPQFTDCTAMFGERIRASWVYGHDDARLSRELARRRCEYDPQHLPWQPKAAYMAKLKAEGRLPGSHGALMTKMLAEKNQASSSPSS